MRPAQWHRVLLSVAPFIVCALIYGPTLSGAFLSDDYAVLAALSDWSNDGRLLSVLLGKFYSGLDAPSFYFRPLSLASFGVNFALSGAAPFAWRVTNLALHLASGALVYVIVRTLAAQTAGTRSAAAPAIAAAVFLLFPTSPEAVAWVSGRYDVLALAFMLAALALFLRSTHWNDRWGMAALSMGACALASKESAVLLPPLMIAMIVARGAAQPGATRGMLRFSVHDVTAWIALGIAYFGLRAAIFGDPFQVYSQTSPLRALSSGAWLDALPSLKGWIEATLPLPFARVILLSAIAALVMLGTVACWVRRAARAVWIAILFSAVASLALLLPHLSALSADGEQGRLFYTTSSLLALLVGVGVAAALAHPIRKWRLKAVLVAAVALIAAEVPLLHRAVAPWSAAGAQARALLAALPTVESALAVSAYGFVLVPDHLGSVPFGRNAQGGLMMPPSQAEPLSSRLIVQTPLDLPAWPGSVQRGLVDALRRRPLAQVWPAVRSGEATGMELPTDYFCWSDGASKIIRIALPENEARLDWMGAWQRALGAGTCTEVSAEVAKRANASMRQLNG